MDQDRSVLNFQKFVNFAFKPNLIRWIKTDLY